MTQGLGSLPDTDIFREMDIDSLKEVAGICMFKRVCVCVCVYIYNSNFLTRTR